MAYTVRDFTVDIGLKMMTIDELLERVTFDQIFGYYDPELKGLTFEEILQTITPKHKCYSVVIDMLEACLEKLKKQAANQKQ
ncbi:hypothetical protein QUF70_01590 [Desulfobacterales bacterium HSG17]|nr:hypothetical protein [Desulfobacterales bacterium HSG17]